MRPIQIRRLTRAAAATALALCAALGSSARIDARADDAVKALVAATQAYVADLESKLAFGVFDEDYTQSARTDAGTRDRTMHGELFLTFLPKDGDWIAVHDIATVDGEPVPDREELATLMQRGPLQSIKAAVIDRNSRFNLGGISRNFNEPTIALLIIEPKRVADFDFSIERVATLPDRTRLATLHFQEKAGLPATLVRGPFNDEARAKGDFIVEVDTGRIRETLFTLDVSGIKVSLSTTYAHDEKADLWVPSVFRETYEGKPKGSREVDTGEARYTNFRRFEVLGKIK